jgi:hypothetical protein
MQYDLDAHLPLATSESNIDKSAGVCDSLLRATFGGLLLFLWLNLPNHKLSASVSRMP